MEKSFVCKELDKIGFYYFDISEKVGQIVYNLFKYGSINGLEDLEKSLTNNEKSDLNVYSANYYCTLGKYNIAKNYVDIALILNSNNSHAIHRLAYLYQEGKGVEKNIETARTLYQQAADLNNAISLINLGNIYSKEKNIEKAIELYTKSANLKNKNASYQLGKIYYFGDQVKKDLELSFKWLKKAEELMLDNPDGTLLGHIGYMFFQGYGTKKDMGKALEYYLKAAELNEPNGLHQVGIIYYNYSHPVMFEEAVEYFKKSAALKYPPAISQLGRCYYYGRGVDQDVNKAIDLLKQACDLKYSRAYVRLGDIYGNEHNYKLMLDCYYKAIELNEGDGLFQLGLCYYNGVGVEKNAEKAFELFTKSIKINKEDQDTIYYLGLCHYHGFGTAVNYFEALRYFGLIRDYKDSDRLISSILDNRNNLLSSIYRAVPFIE